MNTIEKLQIAIGQLEDALAEVEFAEADEKDDALSELETAADDILGALQLYFRENQVQFRRSPPDTGLSGW
jgi:hypothetical protein